MSAKLKVFLHSITLFASLSLCAQEFPAGRTALSLPANPTVLELTRLFLETTAGQHDPFQVIPAVVRMGNKVVPSLRGFLFETPIIKVAVLDSTGVVEDSVNAPPPNRVYGVMALDLIGTPAAYQVLADVVRLDTNGEVRGEALRAFAVNCYSRVVQGSLQPDTGVVHLLLGYMDDTTYVGGCSMKIGSIARQGLQNWTGIDYGEIVPDNLKAKDEKTLGMTLAEYREQWWQQISSTMQWNSIAGCYDLGKPKQK